MSETLYRKYRPQLFKDVAEQEHVLKTIMKQLETNTVAHAYLFSGPRGVGKTTIARLLAKALNCEGRKEGESEPCNTCSACLDFAGGRFLSCVEVDAASQTGVDNVRENIIENARFAPTRGKYKVFILDEVHMLSGSSFNALLKTLEEPPAHAIFILATTELYKIPATIASRCQRFEFHRVPPVVMIPRLVTIAAAEGATVVEDVLAQIARLSEGCLRDAESLLGQVLALGEKNVTLEVASLVLPMTNLATVASIVEAVSMNDARKAIDVLDAFVADGGSVKHLVEELLEYVRTVMFAAFGDTTMDAYDPKTIERIRAAGLAFGVARSRAFLEALLIARTRQSLPALPQIPLEIAILDACSVSSSHSAPSVAPILPAPPVVPTLVTVSKQEVAAPSAPIEYVPIIETSEPAVAPVRYDFSSASVAQGVTADRPSEAIVQDGNPSIAQPTAPAAFPLQTLIDKWERCCALVGEHSATLPIVLQSTVPHDIQGNVVTIASTHAFHTNALKEMKAKKMLEDAIAEVMQVPVNIMSIHIPKKENTDAVTDFISGLGASLA